MENLVSIVVPVYNAEKYLTKCITSILRQDYVNLELILIDDGSTDQSPQICDKYFKEDDRVVVVHNTNQGVAATRNQGVEIATGDYLMFVDADDWIEPNTVSLLLEKIIKYNLDVIECNYRFVHSYKKVPQKNDGKEYLFSDVESIFRASITNCDGALYKVCWGKLYRADLCKLVQFPQRTIAEDAAFCDKLFLMCNRVMKYNVVLYNYRMTTNSIMRSKVKKTVFESFDTALEMEELLNNSNAHLSHEFMEEVQRFVSGVPVNTLNMIIQQGIDPREIDGYNDFHNKYSSYRNGVVDGEINYDFMSLCVDPDKWIESRMREAKKKMIYVRMKRCIKFILDKICDLKLKE